MKIFTPTRLLCLVALHDWIYGFDTSTKQYIKKCNRCNKEEKVDIKEAEKKVPEMVKMYSIFKK